MRILSSIGPKSAINRRPSAARRRPKSPTRRLQLEPLEPRHLLAVVHWDGEAGDGLWQTPLNWSTDQIPGVDDDVVLNVAAAATIRFDGADATIHSLVNHEVLQIEDGSLVVTGPSQIHGQVLSQGGHLVTSDLILAGGSLTVTGSMDLVGRFVMEPGSTLTATGTSASFQATGETSLLGANLYALAGGHISIPDAENYAFASTSGSWETRTLRAQDAGSRLDLPGLKAIHGGSHTLSILEIEALDGGAVEMANVVQIVDPEDDASYEQYFRVRSVGSGGGSPSQIDLSSLVQIIDRSNDGGLDSTLFASDGGRILTSSLRTLQGVHLTLDITTAIDHGQIERMLDSRLTLRGAGMHYAFPVLENGSGTTIEVQSGAHAELTGLSRLVRGTIRLSGGGTANLPNVSNIDGASFFVEDGVTLTLPAGVTNYSFAATDNNSWETRVFRATGPDSRLELPGLKEILGADRRYSQVLIEALGGGAIDLGEVMQIVDSDEGDFYERYFQVRADGSGEGVPSRIDLSSLVQMVDRSSSGGLDSEVTATGGGQILAGNLTTLQHVHLTLDAPDAISTAQIERVLDGKVSVSGAGQTFSFPALENGSGTVFEVTAGSHAQLNGLQRLIRGTISLSGGGTANVPSVTNIDGASFLVEGGVTLALPAAVTNYSFAATDNNNWETRTFRATGSGSRLELPGLKEILGADLRYSQVLIEALSGGAIDLGKVRQIVDSDEGDFYERYFQVRADGSGEGVPSRIDLSSLVQVVDRSSSGGLDSKLTATGGGEILAGNLTTLQHVHLTLDASEGISTAQIERVLEGRVSVSGSAQTFTFPTLENGSGTVFEVTAGAHAQLDVLQRLVRGTISLSGSGTANLPNLTNVDGASFFVEGGVTLTLPAAVTNYAFAATDNNSWETRTFRATGPGSRLELPGLKEILGADRRYSQVLIEALSGGAIDLGEVVQIVDSDEGDSHERYFQIRVDGSGEGLPSRVDLSSLVQMVDRSSSGGLDSKLMATGGGEILTGNLTTLQQVHLTLDAPDAISTAQIERVLDGKVSVAGSGQTFAFPALENGGGTVFEVTAGAHAELDALRRLVRGTISLSGGGTANLPNVTNIDGASFLVEGGVTLTLPAAVTNYSFAATDNNSWETRTFRATGPGSRLELPGLTEFLGADRRYSQVLMEALNGGAIDLGQVVQVLDSDEGDAHERYFQIRADGDGGGVPSHIDLSSLVQIVDRSTSGGTSSSLTATSGGEILAPNLSTVVNFHVQLSGAGAEAANTLPEDDQPLNPFDEGIAGDRDTPDPDTGSASDLPLPEGPSAAGDDPPPLAANGFGDTVLWIAGSGSWNDPANWSSGIVPGPYDRVLIDVAGDDVTITIPSGAAQVWELLCQESLHIAGGSLTVRGTATVHGAFTMQPGTSLIAYGDPASFQATGGTSIDGANLSALYGGQLLLDNAPSYSFASATSNQWETRSWRVEGYGSELDLSGLQQVIGGVHQYSIMQISAYSGGQLQLGDVVRIEDPDDAVTFEQYFQMTTDGIGSIIDLSSLTEFLDHSNHGGLDSRLIARLGGTVLADQLQRIERVTVTLDGTGTLRLPNLDTLLGGQITLSGADYSFPLLNDASETTLFVGDAQAELAALTDLTRAAVTVGRGGAITSATNLQQIHGMSLRVEGGAQWVLPPTITGYDFLSSTDGAWETRSWRVEGYGSELALNGLQQIVSGVHQHSIMQITAYSGGQLRLADVVRIEDPDDAVTYEQYFQITADGIGSVIDLSSMTEFLDHSNHGGLDSTLTARLGGTVLADQLQRIERVAVTLDGTGVLELPILDTVLGGQIALAGANYTFPLLSDASETSVIVGDAQTALPALINLTRATVTLSRGGAITSATNLNQINGASFRVGGGAQLALPPAITGYDFFSSTSNAWETRSWRVEGYGSELDLSGLQQVIGGAHQHSILQISACSGGQLRLANVVRIEDPDDAVTYEQYFQITADGIGSTIDLNSLTEFLDHSNHGGLDSTLTARLGGTVVADQLQRIERVAVTLDGTGTLDLPILHTLLGGQITLSGAHYTFPLLNDVSETTLHVGDAQAELPALTNLTRATVTLGRGGRITSATNVNQIDGASFRIGGGAQLVLPPAITDYDFLSSTSNAWETRLWRVEGYGSELDLSSLQQVFGGVHQYSIMQIAAYSGGQLQLGDVQRIEDPDDAVTYEQYFQIVADGTGTAIDLSSLTEFLDHSNHGGLDSALAARLGGIFLAGQLQRIERVALTLDGTGTLDLPMLDTLLGGQIACSGGNYTFPLLSNASETTLIVGDAQAAMPALNNLTRASVTLNRGGVIASTTNWSQIDGASFRIGGGARLVLPPAITGYDFSSSTSGDWETRSWRVEGYGSELDLSQLQQVIGGVHQYSVMEMAAYNGGQLRLGDVLRIEDPDDAVTFEQYFQITADGIGSVIELNSLTDFLDRSTHGGLDSALTARYGGAVPMSPSEAALTNVLVTVTPTGHLSAGTVRLLGESLLQGSGEFSANVINDAEIGPGGPPGSLTILGNYTQTSSGRLTVEIGGLAAATQHDQLIVTGSALLDGGLNVIRLGNYLPEVDDEFTVLLGDEVSGRFTSMSGLAWGSGIKLLPVYGSVDFRLRAGVDAGPRIVGATPGGTIDSSLRSFQVTFDEPINAASFTAGDIVLVGPQGAVTVHNPALISGNTFQFTVDTQVAPGVYTLTIGPNVTDTAGNPMDQNSNAVNGEPEDVFAHQVTISDVQQAVLFVNVPGNYNADAGNFYQNLLAAGARAKRVDMAVEDVVAAALAADDYDQVWVFDLASAYNDSAYWTAISDWYADDPTMEIICDARILGSLRSGRWQNEGRRLTENYYANLRAAGGGLFLGTDDAVFQSGINNINAAIGIDPFSGQVSWSTIPVDPDHPLMNWPQDLGTSLASDTGPGLAPYGVQPSGRVLYVAASYNYQAHQPGITTTIPGGVDVTPPLVLEFTPLGPQNSAVDQVGFRFSEAIDPATFQPADLSVTGPGGVLDPAAFQIQATAPNAFTVAIPAQSDEGIYQVVLGPDIRDLAGNPLAAAYLAGFTIDTTGPRIVEMMPSATVSQTVQYVDVTFSEPIQAASFTTADVTLLNPDNGPIAISQIQSLGQNVYRLRFATQSANGSYTLTVGPEILDLAGNPMDQTPDGLMGGNDVVPRSMVDDAHGALFFDLDHRISTDGSLTSWEVYAAERSGLGQLKLKIFREVGDIWEFVGESSLETIQNWNAVNTFVLTEPIEVRAGDMLAWWYPQGTVPSIVYDHPGSTPNLIVNPGNEEPLVNGEIPGWTEVVGAGWTQRTANPAPKEGTAYFFPGAVPSAELSQEIDVSAFASEIDSGTQYFAFEGYVRSYDQSPPDTSRIIIEYYDAARTTMLAQFDSGNVANRTAWQAVIDERIAPAGTRWIRVRLLSVRHAGTNNDGYFDDLSLRPIPSVGQTLHNRDWVTVPLGDFQDDIPNLVLHPDALETTWDVFPRTYSIRVLSDSATGQFLGSFAISLPDLWLDPADPESLVAPDTAMFGAPIEVTWTTSNAGNATATGTWTDGLYLSANATWDASDIALGNQSFSTPVDAGASYPGLLSVTLPLSHSLEDGTYYLLVRADDGNAVVETDETNNVLGRPIQLTRPPLPDLTVSAITTTAVSPVAPCDAIEVSWEVHNIGQSTVEGNWTEQIYLSSDGTIGDDIPIAQFTYIDSIAAGGSVPRTEWIAIPAWGVSGDVRLVVVVDSNDAVVEQLEDNNAGIGAAAFHVPLVLNLLLPHDEVAENAPNPVMRAVVTRSGSLAQSLTVSLSSNQTDELTVPASVTIAAGQPSAAFFVHVHPDGVVDGEQTVSLTAQADGYLAGDATVVVLDVDRQTLSVALNVAELTEGDSTTGTVSRQVATAESLLVTLTASPAGELSFPATVTIPGGETSAGFNLSVIDDSIPELTEVITLTATAASAHSAAIDVTVLDNDEPTLSLTFSPTEVLESAGAMAAVGTVSRLEPTGVPLTVRLTSSHTSKALVPTEVVIPAGATSVDFYLAAVDNDVVDGDKMVTIQAVGIIPSCNCGMPPGSGGVVSADVLVLDDDGPTLQIVVQRELLPEGLAEATTGQVLRNTGTAGELTVQLASSDLGELTVPATVVIPDGADRSEPFALTTVEDGISDGPQTVTVTASVDGYLSGVVSVIVTDIDVPDLIVSDASGPATVLAERWDLLSYTVANVGLAEAVASNADPEEGFPGSWQDRVYLSDDPVIGNDTLIRTYTFTGTLPNDPSMNHYSREVPFRAPLVPGDYWVVVTTDLGQTVAEGVETNNTVISQVPIRVQAAYSATVQTDIEQALAGTLIPMTGQAIDAATSGPAQYVMVNIHIQVRGTTRVIAAITDDNGQFSTTFRPLPGEAGHYTIAATHPGVSQPGEAQDAFVLIGMGATPGRPAATIDEGAVRTVELDLENLSDVPLSGLDLALISQLDNLQVTLPADLPADLGGLASVWVAVEITALDASVEQGTVLLRFTTTEGASLDVPIDVTVNALRARLVPDRERILAAALRSRQTVVEFQVTNTGAAASGPIEVRLPELSWLSLGTLETMASLEPGASGAVVLLLSPPADAMLTAYEGQLVLATGQGEFAVPFTFRVVSEAKGTLEVSAVNEYYFYTDEKPKLAGATVIVRDAVTRAELFSATTDHSGTISFPDLPEGYYTVEVSAADHDSHTETLFLAADQTNQVLAYLRRQTVKYRWSVERIEIEDRYRVSIETVFETNVPAPVVTVDPPLIDMSDLLVVGQRMQVDLTLTNHGLISADNTELVFGNHPEIRITPLVRYIGELPAKSSLTVPVLIERVAPPAPDADMMAAGGSGICTIPAHVVYSWECIDDRWVQTELYTVPPRDFACPAVPPGGGGAGGGGGGGGAGSVSSVPFQVSGSSCDPCLDEFLDLLLCFLPGDCLVGGAAGCAKNAATAALSGQPQPTLGDCLKDTAEGCLLGLLPGSDIICVVQGTCGFLLCLDAFDSGSLAEKFCNFASNPFGDSSSAAGECGSGCGCNFVTPASLAGAAQGIALPYGGAVGAAAAEYLVWYERWLATLDPYLYVYGDYSWILGDPAAEDVLLAYHLALSDNSDAGIVISQAELQEMLASAAAGGIAAEHVERLSARWNRTWDYWSQGMPTVSDLPPDADTDFIDAAVWLAMWETHDDAFAEAASEGYASVGAGFNESLGELKTAMSEMDTSDGICAQVRIRLDQDAVMTREAFRATLELANATAAPLTDVGVSIVITDASGQNATDRFAVRAPSLQGIAAVDGSGSVAPGSTAIAQWVVVPTGEAAADAVTEYFVGGTLTYRENDVLVTTPLFPVPITVHPQAELDLHYFHQRDVFSDDPWTDEIEPAQPYQLAVMVQNHGAGQARNLRIESAQPQIVENEKGLLIDFKIIGTEVAGQNLTPSLTANFGDLAPGEIKIGRWWLTSTLQGQFISYDATFEHLDGLGDERLSLIKNVDIHELIHTVRADGPFEDGLPDFLVNDLVDPDDLPDTLYLSDGSVALVSLATDPQVDGTITPQTLTAQLTMTAEGGWSYLRLKGADPGGSDYRLTQVLRADNSQVPAENFWQTDRTFVELGRQPIVEDSLHLFDHAAESGPRTYTLVYEKRDQFGPVISDLETPDSPGSTAVAALTATFSEPLLAGSFDWRDLSLQRDGEPVLLDNRVNVSLVSGSTYQISGLDAFTQTDGQYELTLDATSVMDQMENPGTGQRAVIWIKAAAVPYVVAIHGLGAVERNTPVEWLEIEFSQPIVAGSFSAADLTLTRDEGDNLIDPQQSGVTVAQIGPVDFRVNLPVDLTQPEGDYRLTVSAEGVTDLDGNPGVGQRSTAWTMDTTPPEVVSITGVGSVTNQSVSALTLTFSEPLDATTLTAVSLSLSRDGGGNLLADPVQIQHVQDGTYRLIGLSPLTNVDGQYLLSVDGTALRDRAGNAGMQLHELAWTRDSVAPAPSDNLRIAPDTGVSDTDLRTNVLALTVSGDVSEAGLTVHLLDVTTGTDLGLVTVTNTTFQHEVVFTSAGLHQLRVRTTDAAGNYADRSWDLFLDVVSPQVAGVTVAPDPQSGKVEQIAVDFSEALAVEPLISDGSILDAVQLIHATEGAYTLATDQFTYDPAARRLVISIGTFTPGVHELRLDGSRLEDLAGNPLRGGSGGVVVLDIPALAAAQLVQVAGSDLQVDAYSVPSLADWNGDGLPDLIVGERTLEGEGKVRVSLNRGTADSPVFEDWFYATSGGSDLTVPGGFCLGVFPRLFDWDDDGLPDLVLGLADGTIQWRRNIGTAGNPDFGAGVLLEVGPAGQKSPIYVGQRATLEIADVNGDGRYDLVVGALDGRVRVYLNTALSGSADFLDEQLLMDGAVELLVPDGRSSPAVVDWNGDGLLDLLVGNTSGQLLYYANTGSQAEPRFDGSQLLSAGGAVIDLPGMARSRPSVTDFNNDGRWDLLVGASDGLVRLYLGQAVPATTAQATDLGEAGEWYTHTFIPQQAPTEISLATVPLAEGQPVGSLTGILTASDPDIGETFTFSLTPGSGDEDNGLFQIAGNRLETAAVLDYEHQSQYQIRVRATDSTGLWHEQTFVVGIEDVQGVVARHLFYNHSSFDGNDPTANEADDSAIAPDKQPLLPGQLAALVNYSSFEHGINGVILDIENLADATAVGQANFQFQVGNDNATGEWLPGPAPSSVTLRAGAGPGGADRITLIWPDGAIRNQWLRVTVLADDITGLAAPDVFYFGNAVGETGDVAGDTLVDRYDAAAVVANPRGPDDPALITDPYDFNRDGLVDGADQALAETYATDPDTHLRLLDLRQAGLPEVSVSVSPDSVLEGGEDVLTYTFTRSGSVDDAATVTFRVTGSAMYPDDYSVSGAGSFTEQLGTVAFAAGSSTAELMVQPTDDILFEGDETVWLLVLPGEGYAVGGPDSARGTIIDDDPAIGLQLLVVGSPSAAGSTELPSGLGTVSWGSTYYVEVWVQDRVAPGVGITGGYVDVNYTTGAADAVSVFNLDFDLESGGKIDVPGVVTDLGGGTLAGGRGIAPQWARLGYVQFTAAQLAQATFELDAGSLEFSRFGAGSVPWDLVDFGTPVAVDQIAGTQIDMTIVHEPSGTGDNGEVSELPASADWVHEWQSFWVEIWVSTPHPTTVGITEAMVDLHYFTDSLTAQEFQHGPAFTEDPTGDIEDNLGRVHQIGGKTVESGLGQDGFVLLARVRFASTGEDQVPVDEVRHKIGLYDMQMALANGHGRLAEGDIALAVLGESPETELWAVMYDIDDNNVIDFGELSFFAAAFGRTVVSTTEPPYVWWADFDKSGRVDFGDLAFFAPNFNKSRTAVQSGAQTLIFPSNFPNAWDATSGGGGGGESESEGESESGGVGVGEVVWEPAAGDVRVAASSRSSHAVAVPQQLAWAVDEAHAALQAERTAGLPWGITARPEPQPMLPLWQESPGTLYSRSDESEAPSDERPDRHFDDWEPLEDLLTTLAVR